MVRVGTVAVYVYGRNSIQMRESGGRQRKVNSGINFEAPFGKGATRSNKRGRKVYRYPLADLSMVRPNQI